MVLAVAVAARRRQVGSDRPISPATKEDSRRRRRRTSMRAGRSRSEREREGGKGGGHRRRRCRCRRRRGDDDATNEQLLARARPPEISGCVTDRNIDR